MSFSKEDKAAWLDSEVMRELEKIAAENDILNGPPEEAFMPISEEIEEESEEESWEDERTPEEKLEDALMDFESDSVDKSGILEEEKPLKEELAQLYMDNLISNLKTLSYDLTEQGFMKAAYRIERAIKIVSGGVK
jgi:hypothetical protein